MYNSWYVLLWVFDLLVWYGVWFVIAVYFWWEYCFGVALLFVVFVLMLRVWNLDLECGLFSLVGLLFIVVVVFLFCCWFVVGSVDYCFAVSCCLICCLGLICLIFGFMWCFGFEVLFLGCWLCLYFTCDLFILLVVGWLFGVLFVSCLCLLCYVWLFVGWYVLVFNCLVISRFGCFWMMFGGCLDCWFPCVLLWWFD